MAINPESQYPGKIAPATSAYPYGGARNITVPGDGTGTPWEAALVNDLFGFWQSLLSQTGIVPSGTPDSVGASQYLQALYKLSGLTVTTLTALKAFNVTQVADGTVMRMAFRSNISDQGGGFFAWDSSDLSTEVTSDPQNGLYVPPNSDATGASGAWRRINYASAFAEWFGAAGDGSTDDYTAIQALLTLRLPWELIDNKSYATSQELSISNSDFNGRLFFCQGLAELVAIESGGSFTGDSIIVVSNGSGQLNTRKIEGVQFTGLSDRSLNLCEIRGACGIRGYRCKFRNGLAGLKLSNDVGSGTFTEGVIFYDSRFENCDYPLEFYRGAGNDSFHGSGLENCWINTRTGSPAVRVGDGCLPYNSVFSATVFCDDDNTSLVFLVEGTTEPRPPMFVGSVRTEGEIATLAAGDRNVYLIGGVTGLGAQDFGRLYIAHSVRSTGPAAGNLNAVVNLAPYRRGFEALSGESVLLAPSDSMAYVHMVAGGTEYYFKVFSYSNSTGTTTYATPEVYIGDLSGLTFTTSDAGVALTMPADGTLKIRVESSSIRYAAINTAALEYKE